MNRIFTFLLALFISVTLLAQKSTVAEPQMPETFTSRLRQDILKKLDRPELFNRELFNMDNPVEGLEQKFNVKSGRPLNGIQDEGNPFPGLDEAQELKSAVAAKKRLDSIVSDKEIVVYEYDENGNHTSTVVYTRDTITDPFMLDWKMEAAFDEDDRIIMQAEYSWVDSLMAWIGDWKDEYTRDENGNFTSLRFYEWRTGETKSEIKAAEAGDWELDEEWSAEYDEDGNETDFSIFGRDWETGEWVGIYIQHYIFDANSRPISSTSSSLYNPTTGQFEPQYKMENEHDANGNLTKWEESKWEEEVAKSESNAGAGLWVYTFKGENTYDANDYTLSQAWFIWDLLLNAWAGTTQFVYTYDEDENRTSYAFLYWNADSSRWENWQIDIYSYDEGGNHVKTVSSNWDIVNQKWVEMSKSDYTFNSDGFRTSTNTYNKDMISGEWMQSYMEVRTYNDKNYLTSSIDSYWNEDSAKLIVQSKQELTYDANGSMTSSAYYGWDYLLNILTGYWRVDYTRDDDGNVLTFTEFLWMASMNDWVPKSRLDYTYDYDFTGFDILAPFYMWAMITSYSEYVYQDPVSKSSQEWIKIDEFIYYYSDLEVGVSVADLSVGELSIYPNPAADYIQVEGDLDTDAARVVMYNVSGKMVMNQVLDRGGRIPVSHLSEGIYVIRLVQGDKVKTAKVMIE
jgi:hypothetical protein